MSTEKKRQDGEGVDLKDRQKIEPPNKYKVVLHNDDYTPMDFVIVILMDAFNFSFQKAAAITMQVHEQGKGIAGAYSKEIAFMKVKKCNKIARAEGHPLKVTMEVE
tara:strand:+ start:461 stop:778 length:318 start_codon:yes stop_codon:yes gene_type:complete